MWQKIKSLLGSIRFWQLVIAAILLILRGYGIIPPEVADTVAGLLGISTAVGTIDKFAKTIAKE